MENKEQITISFSKREAIVYGLLFGVFFQLGKIAFDIVSGVLVGIICFLAK